MRVVFHIIASPITLLLCFVFIFDSLFAMLIIIPIEIVTGKFFGGYWACEPLSTKLLKRFTRFIDNASYYIYCKITKDEYKRNYWLNN